MSSKKRKWSDEYVQHGFTCITERDGSQRPICIICNAKLSNSSLAPAKLKEHFLKLHADEEYKNTTHAEFKVKRARFDEKATLPIDKPILTASYLIAKQGKPQTIVETLIKPAALKMANLILGTAAEGKLSQIPLSNDTISDRIEDMSKDTLAQVVADLISSPAKFSLELDEATDVSNLSQIAVFVRYVKDDMIKEDFSFCKPLTTTTKAAEVKKLVDDFFRENNLSGIGDISVPMELKQAISTHLDELAKSLDGYFPTRESYPAWVRQPFTFAVETADVNDEYLDKIIEIQQSQAQKQLFRTTTLSTFLCQQMEFVIQLLLRKPWNFLYHLLQHIFASNPFRGCWT